MKNYDVRPVSSLDEILLNGVRNAFQDFFECEGLYPWWTLGEIFQEGRTGPGSSLKANGQSFYQKLFTSPLTTTSFHLYSHYVQALRSLPAWAAANDLRSRTYGELVVGESRLSFVPKTDKIARTICTEPSLNMFYQLGLGRLIERKLRQVYGIDLEIQPNRNRRLTRIGSLDGSFSTIDLSSASDNFSYTLLKWLLRPNSAGRNAIEALRTPRTRLPSGETLELHMVSTMGNGFTFPLQTLLFTCAVVSVYQTFSIKPRNRPDTQNFAVFGDDIVVRTETFNRLCRLLELLGFQVNGDKSFSEGFFRESCGSDYFLGRNVRGVYLKDLTTQQDRYSAINRLNEWSSNSGIPLPNTVQYLLRTVKYIPVPRWEADVSGVKIPFWMLRNKGGRYRYFKPVAVTQNIECPECLRLKIPCTHINSEGAYVSLLHGSLRDGRITPRQRSVRYVLKTRSKALWSDVPSDVSFPKSLGRKQSEPKTLPWDMAVWINLARD
jgi:hypothetical protein